MGTIWSKVSIITIGTWYKALWSPNLTWNHNKKVFHLFFWNFSFQKLHTHLFSGNDRNRATKVNKNSKVVKIYFFKPKVIKMYFFNQKMVEHQNIPMSFNFSDPGAYITYLMLLYLLWVKSILVFLQFWKNTSIFKFMSKISLVVLNMISL